MTDIEKKKFMQLFIKRIDIPKEKVKDGIPFSSIKLSFPIYYNGEEGDEVCLRHENEAETCCLLTKRRPDTYVHLTVDMEDYYRIKDAETDKKNDSKY